MRVDPQRDAFIAVQPGGRLFMGVEVDGAIHDRELYLLGRREPVKGAQRKSDA